MSEPKIDKRSKAYKESLLNTETTEKIIKALDEENIEKVQELLIEDLEKVMQSPIEKTDANYLIGVDTIDNLSVSSITEVIITKQQEPIKEPIKQNNMSTATLSNEITAPILKEIKGKISIKPYVSNEENMGLEKYGEALFPGIFQMDRIGCIENNGYKTYFTGLNENAPEVQMLPEDKKIAKITTIRQVVAYLENKIANNFKVRSKTCMEGYGTETDKFWENVTTFISSGPDKFDAKGNRVPTYWDSVEVKLDNDGIILDKSNAHDLVKYYAILDSGLGMIASSLTAAMNSQGAYKFYLDQPEETSDIKTAFKKLRNQSGAALESMRLNDENRLFYMSKILAIQGSSMYRRGGPNYTPINSMYEDQCRYIDGEAGDLKTIAVEKFLNFYGMSIDELNRRAVIKDALEQHIIEPKGDGRIFFKNEPLGKTIEDIIEHLGNPVNESIWVGIRNKVEEDWAS